MSNWNSTTAALHLVFINGTATMLQRASAPLATKVYSNYQDNQNLQVASDERFAGGNYLWVLTNPSGTAGVWKKEGEMSNAQNFKNGEIVAGSYQSFLLLNPSSGAHYWDQASYIRSTDGGKNWSAEKMVLKPTEGTRPAFYLRSRRDKAGRLLLCRLYFHGR